MRKTLTATLVALAAAAAFSSGACKKTAPIVEPLCDANVESFCKCPGGGDDGTHTCDADGSAFSECVTPFGPCPEIPESTSSTSEGGGPTGGPPGVGGVGGSSSTDGAGGRDETTSTGTGQVGTLALYEPCGAQDSACASGFCPMGFCSQPCTKTSECGAGVCADVDAQAFTLKVCAPECTNTFPECTDPYKGASACGFVVTTDGKKTAVCADWGNKLALPPDGAACTGANPDFQCHLGHVGKEFICYFDTCTTGCYEDLDCPEAVPKCSSSGATPGTCGAAGAEI